MMKRLIVDPRAESDAAILEAAELLRQGAVVAYPTDTLYGLAVDPTNNAAVEKLFAIKQRATTAAIPLIAADAQQACVVGHFGASERQLARIFWPGPLTIVVPAAPAISPLISASRGTVGVRVPAHAVARGLAAAFGACISATSANPSGKPPAMTADEAAAALDLRIDLLLDGGPVPGGPPSTIVEIIEGRLTLHRPGAVEWDRVLKSLE